MTAQDIIQRLGEPASRAILENWERYAEVPNREMLSLEQRWILMMQQQTLPSFYESKLSSYPVSANMSAPPERRCG